MTISSVQIANFALAKIGDRSTIESLTEDSTEANLVNLWFDFVKEQALSSFNWSFATKRQTLAAHSEDPPDDWSNRYMYPSDCLKIRSLENPGGVTADPVAFDVELDTTGVKSILCNTEEAVAVYTANITNPGLFSPYFIELFATMLAAKIAFSITGKTGLIGVLQDETKRLMILAPAFDAVEQQEREPRDAYHIRERA